MGRSRARFASARRMWSDVVAPYGTPAHSDPALWGVPEWRSLISSTPPHKVSRSRTSDEVGVRTSRGPLSLAHCMLHRRAPPNLIQRSPGSVLHCRFGLYLCQLQRRSMVPAASSRDVAQSIVEIPSRAQYSGGFASS
jgi:hypothetical protein